MFFTIFTDVNKKQEEENIVNTEEIKKPYDFTKPIEELELEKIEDYVDYVTEVSKQLKPIELQKLVNINSNFVIDYERSDYGRNETGKEILDDLYSISYSTLLSRVVKHGEDWSNLPLTEHFRNKFTPEKGVLINQYHIYNKDERVPIFDYTFDGKIFGVSCENEKGEEYYGYYKFVLDDEGYLDDVIYDHDELIPWEPLEG